MNSNRFLLISLLAITPVLLFFNFRVLKSYQQQATIISNINSSNFTFKNRLEEIETEFPNISVTSMSLRVIKAKYLIVDEKYERALSLLNSVEYDPLHYKEGLKCDIFLRNSQLDSLYDTSKKAHLALPLNTSHIIYYLKAISLFNQWEKAIDIYEKYNLRNGDPKWAYFYFASLYPHKDKYPIIKEQAQKALKRYQNKTYGGIINQELNVILYFILYGEENYKSSLDNFNEGNDLFSKQQFKNAAIKYNNAWKAFPINPDYYYNEMVCYFELGLSEKVVSIYKKIGKDILPDTGKFEFLVARSFLKNKDTIKACNYFKISEQKGFDGSLSYLKKTCKK